MRKKEKQFYSWYIRQFKPFKWHFLFLCTGTVLQSVLQVLTVAYTKVVVDSGIACEKNFAAKGILFLCLLAGQVLLRAFVNHLAGSVNDRSSAMFRYRILEAAEHSSGEKQKEFHSGALLNRSIEDVKTVSESFTQLLPSILGSMIRLTGAVVLLVCMLPQVAIVLLTVSIVIGIGILCMRPKLRKCHKQVRDTEEKAYVTMQEYSQQIEILKALSAEKESLLRFQKRLKTNLFAKQKRRRWMLSGTTVLSAFMQCGTGVMLLWGTYAISVGRLTYGMLATFQQLASLFYSPMMKLAGVWGRFTAVEVAGERLHELLTLEADEKEEVLSKPNVIKAIVFEHVTFAYKEENNVLEDYNARFEMDEWNHLTGVSGFGKSTIMKLILDIYQPQSGRIYMETDCGNVPCSFRLRKFFAYVPQDYTLFYGSILENLLLAVPNATLEDCVQALKTAKAEFVFELPEGIHTQIQEQRNGLSMGQLQRIAIARAVLMKRQILLLDECTSALDKETEYAVLSNLKNCSKGAIVATHHPEVLQGVE